MEDKERIREYYRLAATKEQRRLDSSDGYVEERLTKALILKHAAPRGRVLDLGGGPGRYALWLARQGHRLTLADLSPDLLELARREIAQAELWSAFEAVVEADACDLGRWPDSTFDTVLGLGPFYHLISPEERDSCAREIARVLKPSGTVFAAFISRWAFLRRVLSFPDERVLVADREWIHGILHRGEFRNPHGGRFPIGYGADPKEIAPFFRQHGFVPLGLHAVESIAGGIDHELAELESSKPDECKAVLDILLRVSDEASLISFYGHMLYIGRKEPNQAPEPTVTAVTPHAAHGSRQP